MSLTKSHVIASWLLQVTVAVILFQTLFFKFTGAEESVYIFTTLGVEPWGRIATGLLELVAVVLILLPPTVPYGAALAAGLMCGALVSHTTLGLVVRDDGGLLFALAVTVLVSSVLVLVIRRAELPVLASFGGAVRT
jgi:putative oxidoreductase